MNIVGFILAVFLSVFNVGQGMQGEVTPPSQAGYYAECGVVIEDAVFVNEETYDVAFETQGGNLFSFYSEDGDWMKGDLVAAIFYDNGTAEVYDDMVIYVRYSGWVSCDEMEIWIKR